MLDPEELGENLAESLKSAKDLNQAWQKVAEIIIEHIQTNAVVTGTTPNGGPLVDGKIK